MLVTTSQNPSIPTRALAFRSAKKLNAQFFARGKRPLAKLIEKGFCGGHGAILVFTQRNGMPFSVKAMELREGKWNYLLESRLGKGFDAKKFCEGVKELAGQRKL